MSLMLGKAPFGTERGAFNFGPIPQQVAYVEDWPRRMRAVFAGETVLDSRRGKMLHRAGMLPIWVCPLEDVRKDALIVRDPGRRWTLRVGDRSAEGAVTIAPDDGGPTGAALHGMVAVDYAVIDWWFEEDDPIYAHPRDPYHRVDVRSSSRHVIVRYQTQVIAESHRPKLLFETGIPIRYYVPFADVRIDLLEFSDTVSECPYNGDGQHWRLHIGATQVRDVAWSLPHPLPEGMAAAQHVCFYPDKVTTHVDGEVISE